MRNQFLCLFVLIFLLLAACTPKTPLSRDEKLATIVAKTLTAQPDFTPIPTSTRTLLPTITISKTPTATNTIATTSSGPVYVRTIVQNVNLRTNPGTLFSVSRVLPEGTRLQVLGLSPGEEWVSVLNSESIKGWIRLPLLEEFPTNQFPITEPEGVQLITGHVLDENGQPISGIGYLIEQQNGSKTLQTNATTDETGTFYAYLPQSVSGIWTVSHISISCTSNTMNTNCNCINNVCGSSSPLSASVTLPVTGTLSFTWK